MMMQKNIRKFLLLYLLLLIAVKSSLHIKEHVVCNNTIDIRKSEDLHILQNCTAVLGNVVLIVGHEAQYEDNYIREEINKWTFPLREITGFLFIHSMRDLDSLSTMFPNLTIIRGQKLFFNYALIIHDTKLKEIGLTSLLRISRGSVRIDGENTNLCLPKIDWDSIIQFGRMISNKGLSNCTSPIKDICDKCVKGFCWNNDACQRFTKPLNNKIPRCHDFCIGDCYDSTPKGCFVCKDLSEDFECVERCSSERYLNADTRRCLIADDCIKLGRKIHVSDCLQDCPAGFSDELEFNDETKKLGYCKPCKNQSCPKICNLPEIRNVAQLEGIGYGCTIINGSLEIRIIEDISNITAELQTYLGKVKEILGNLKIYRSNAITTLTFLNNLELVVGSQNKSDENAGFFTSIKIYENQNLQNIFDWKLRGDQKLTVKHGQVSIYNNVRLCDDEVNKFAEIIEMINNEHQNTTNVTEKNHTKKETQKRVIFINNGYKKKCKSDHIITRSRVTSHDKCIIYWTDKSVGKKAVYMIQYVPIDDYGVKEVVDKMFFEKDVCSNNGWINVIVTPENYSVENNEMKFVLKNLVQYTNYVFTVQNYISDSSEALRNSSAASDPKVFKTELLRPSRVTKFQTELKSSNSITLGFDVLPNEESAIDLFVLHIFEQKIDKALLDSRDYCKNPIEDHEREDNVMEIDEEEEKRKCCEMCCESSSQMMLKNDDFRNSLINLADNEGRKDIHSHLKNMQEKDGFIKDYIINQTLRLFTVSHLKPFTFYTFHIYACTKLLGKEICSEYEIYFDKTAPNENFDRIKINSLQNDSLNSTFMISFNEPRDKNGAIVSYHIELRMMQKDNDSLLISSKCITRKQHEDNEFNYLIDTKNLPSGNYKFSISAISLSGEGEFSEYYFHVYDMTTLQDKKSDNLWGLIVCGVLISTTLIALSGLGYYYKHKIVIFFRRRDDSTMLLEPTDFHRASLNRARDTLFDIMENKEY